MATLNDINHMIRQIIIDKINNSKNNNINSFTKYAWKCIASLYVIYMIIRKFLPFYYD